MNIRKHEEDYSTILLCSWMMKHSRAKPQQLQQKCDKKCQHHETVIYLRDECHDLHPGTGNCKVQEQQQLNRIVRTTSRTISAPIPLLAEIYQQRCVRRATAIIMDPHHHLPGC